MYSDNYLSKEYREMLKIFAEYLATADAVVIGAGAGLSAAAGLEYSGERFEKYFSDFITKYRFSDMYSAAFYPFKTQEERWAYWSKHIYHNRYQEEGNDLYKALFDVVKDKNYFVITTNVDHMFRQNGFEKERLFYTQGDYGLFQCKTPCHSKTYDNRSAVFEMLKAQKDLKIPSELVPLCPVCSKPMSMNLRADSTFVEDEGWHAAMGRYEKFIRQNSKNKVLYLEFGIGANTPAIIKYPFWQMVHSNKNSLYCCVNINDAICPKEIEPRALCFEVDIVRFIADIAK